MDELEEELITDEELELELKRLLLDDELLLLSDDEATAQLAAIFWVRLTMVLLASFLTTMRVQPLAAVSEAGKESLPQAPLGSTLKRGPPPLSLAVKLRQISKVVVEPATGVSRSPSAQPL